MSVFEPIVKLDDEWSVAVHSVDCNGALFGQHARLNGSRVSTERGRGYDGIPRALARNVKESGIFAGAPTNISSMPPSNARRGTSHRPRETMLVA